jgi:DNA excision repair protein ERCC-5
LDDKEIGEERDLTEIEKEYKEKHKNWRKHWEFPIDFPNHEIIKAYKDPNIDDSDSAFSWGKPDFRELREMALRNFSWTGREID